MYWRNFCWSSAPLAVRRSRLSQAATRQSNLCCLHAIANASACWHHAARIFMDLAKATSIWAGCRIYLRIARPYGMTGREWHDEAGCLLSLPGVWVFPSSLRKCRTLPLAGVFMESMIRLPQTHKRVCQRSLIFNL